MERFRFEYMTFSVGEPFKTVVHLFSVSFPFFEVVAVATM